MTRVGSVTMAAGILFFVCAGAGCGKDRKRTKKSASAERSASAAERTKKSASAAESGPDERTKEALKRLDMISKGAMFYYATPHVLDTGQKVPCQFPATQGPTPAVGTCCGGIHDGDRDTRCDYNPALWDEETWSALSFQMADQHHYSYEIKSSGTLKDAKMEIFAYGDLDCDGKVSTFKRTIAGDPQANFAECSAPAPGPIEKINPNA